MICTTPEPYLSMIWSGVILVCPESSACVNPNLQTASPATADTAITATAATSSGARRLRVRRARRLRKKRRFGFAASPATRSARAKWAAAAFASRGAARPPASSR